MRAAVAAIGDATSAASVAAGYEDGFLAAAGIALALAVVALAAVPSVTPSGSTQAFAQ